jgi:pSer/pThr/pTyr-binding forkhead associated (FHA) protein
VITDLGSRNGTHVNGRRVVGTVRVADGDEIGFGVLSFRLDLI